MRFITNVPAVDYLTITTFVPDEHAQIVAIAVDSTENGGVTEPASRMQYTGQIQEKTDGSFFWGEGEQKGLRHFLHQASGAFSHKLANAFFSTGMWTEHNISRLDIQLTLPKPEWFKSRSLVDSLRAGDWPGRQRKVVSYDNNGDDTVYIGSRQSDRYCRIYVKDKDFLRCEFEYKGDRAYAVADLIDLYGLDKVCAGVLHRELLALPKHPIIQGFIAHIRSDPIKPVVQRVDSNTYKWFTHSVVPSIKRLLNDHDSGERVRRILVDLLQENVD